MFFYFLLSHEVLKCFMIKCWNRNIGKRDNKIVKKKIDHKKDKPIRIAQYKIVYLMLSKEIHIMSKKELKELNG